MDRDRRNTASIPRRRPPLTLLAGCLAVFTLTVGCGLAWPHLQSMSGRVPSAPEASVVRVIDGDTFAVATGEHIRILNIDTAEMPPRAECDREAELALQAKARLRNLLDAGEVELVQQGRDQDRYGRLLRRVRVGEQDVGEVLVREGLAQRWRGRKAQWC